MLTFAPVDADGRYTVDVVIAFFRYIADRLDIDDPIDGYCIRTEKEGWLQGFITWTPFTTWQVYFRWDSCVLAADMADAHDGGKGLTRKLDDGDLARELQQQIYQGDPEDGGVVWPRIAEISLLGGIGCGRNLAEAALEELEATNSNFEYAVLQATDNSIPFYESLGFVRVGAVARYSLREEDGSLADYKFEESHITSQCYWYVLPYRRLVHYDFWLTRGATDGVHQPSKGGVGNPTISIPSRGRQQAVSAVLC